MKKIISIGGERKFSMLIRVAGSFFLFAIIYAVFLLRNELLFIFSALLLSPLIPALWMSRKVREINLEKNYIHDFLFVLGLKIGKKQTIKKARYLSSEAKEILMDDGSRALDYEIYLHYNENEKIRLVYATTEEERDEKIKIIGQRLQLEH